MIAKGDIHLPIEVLTDEAELVGSLGLQSPVKDQRGMQFLVENCEDMDEKKNRVAASNECE